MIQIAKIIETAGLAITGLIGTNVGIGVLFIAFSFAAKVRVIKYGIIQFYTDTLQVLLGRSSHSLEWSFSSPPKPHAFVSIAVQSGVFYHLGEDINKPLPVIVGGKGNYLYCKDGRKIFDASGGAGVSCIGHGNTRIAKMIYEILKLGFPYASSTFWSSAIAEELCKLLIRSTNGVMGKVYLTGSGSEAMEAAIKLSRQYFYIQDKNTRRVNFIYRDRSYHGNTIGALSVSGFSSRKEPYLPLLMSNVYNISSCYPYRQLREGESIDAFVARKAGELEAKILELGPETVIGFIAEPVVGAALGCVPSVPGYFKAMKAVCHKYGILFIVDEVMCGTGRTGSFHAWQAEEGFTPDIQTMAKGLGAGYQPIGAVLISPEIIEVFSQNGPFVHGQTYEGMPIQAAAALEVLNIIEEKNLIPKVHRKGLYLGQRLTAKLSNNPYVGNIRGRGLFWGVEFVMDKLTKKPFDPRYNIAYRIQKLALLSPYNMTFYQSNGCVDGVFGDHIMIAPSFMVTYKDIDYIVDVLSIVIEKTFENIDMK